MRSAWASALPTFSREIESLVDAPSVFLRMADLPETPGVHLVLRKGEVVYVGKAAGSAGLRDRLRKHISGDKSHALQRALLAKIPDRVLRRDHIRSTFSIKWVAVEDKEHVSIIEQIAIWLYRPEFNRAR
jgi:excinuclease UvrABC nuclease subunit